MNDIKDNIRKLLKHFGLEPDDSSDFLLEDESIQNGDGGYLVTDLNGDAAVDAADFLILDPNMQNGIGAELP